MSTVQDLRREIRDFIQHPRRLSPLLHDKPNWNMLVSSFDTLSDTQYAIETYEAMPAVGDTGMLYLVIYGILQALYVQQDTVESMVRAFEPNAQPRYRIEDEPEADEIRKIRNRAIGHPTVEGNVKSRKTPGVQMSHRVVQHSMHKAGFTLMTGFADGSYTFTDVSIPELIHKNRSMVERVLRRIKDKLEAADMEHQKQFKGEKLADIFPQTLDYYFEKILAGIDSPASDDGKWANHHLQRVAEVVQGFRAALGRRGELNRTSNYEYYLAEVEYPIVELQQYYAGTGSLKDPRAARIFAYFARDKVCKLEKMAIELDEEYEQHLSPEQGSTNPGA